MNITTQIEYGKIKVSEPQIADTYYIEQGENDKFFVWSENGYHSVNIGEIEFSDLSKALSFVKKLIKNYFANRCEEKPKGW